MGASLLKIPSLIIPIAANQLEGSLALEQHSCLMLLCNDIDVSLRNNLLRLIADHALLSALSLESSKLVDGKGSVSCANNCSREMVDTPDRRLGFWESRSTLASPQVVATSI